ncbi:hypothetical protein AVEN_254758-1 [Araneus ventricosus]|uniref:Uncharacterized protein n=1 Tax=Araneus ventricosus TaxID=182803 RepID=A0A4Y2QUS1_ARAVE|nr:hypothetical protein AVEN_254758-1 [Araneus ventricosus]
MPENGNCLLRSLQMDWNRATANFQLCPFGALVHKTEIRPWWRGSEALSQKRKPQNVDSWGGGGVPVLKPGRRIGAVTLGDRSDRWYGASVNDPPKWMG